MNDKIIYEGIQDIKVGMQVDPEMVPLRQIINQLEQQ
jgi:hypothetical protein